VIKHTNPDAAWELCLELMENGLLAKPTHGDKIRFAPPLLITGAQIMECVEIIKKSLVVLV
jgi:ornithine--oxo-acid transaminase